MSTPTPGPWVADGYDLRQKHGRMIAYFGPHHTPADEYPMSCRLQDEANAQWVAAARNELAAAKAECNRLYESSPTALDALTAELTRLRADNVAAHQMACAAGLERDQLRAELKELSQAYELNRVSIDELDADRARAEKAEAALAEAKVERETVAEASLRSLESYIDKLKQFAERAEKAEAECLEQARLLGMSGEREADLLGKIDRLNRVIERASVQFFHDGSDGETAAKMLTVLNEAK